MSKKAQCFSKSRPPCMQAASLALRCLSKARWPQVRRLRKLSVWQLVVATAAAETCTRSKSADVVARLRVRGRADRGVSAVFDQSEGEVGMRWLAKMIVCLLFGVAAPQIVPECTLPLRGFSHSFLGAPPWRWSTTAGPANGCSRKARPANTHRLAVREVPHDGGKFQPPRQLRGVRGEEGGDKGASVTTPAKMNVLDLFSGIGVFSLGLERAGFKTVAFCEINRFCRRVLAKHWPEVSIYDDVRTLTAERLRADGIRVDVVCGGFPCTDISRAKMHRWTGIDGEQSGLWSEYARLIGELRPLYAIVENTADLLGRGFERILGDLAALGYDAEWHCITAAAVNAPHLRDRLWLVAYPNCERLEGQHG